MTPRLSVKEKREAVRLFKSGLCFHGVEINLAYHATAGLAQYTQWLKDHEGAAEEAIRDYINGKFHLKPRRKAEK